MIAAVETTVVSLEVNRDVMVHGARGISHASSSFVLVRVTTTDGVSGFGEVSATPLWSGEDAETSTHLIRDLMRPALVGQQLTAVAALTARLDRVVAGNPFTKAGVNMALWDALGRVRGMRVAELLGGPFRDEVAVKFSLSGNGDELENCYEAVVRRGFRSFKVKVGLAVEDDVERFRRVRELAGGSAFIGADANAGWTRLDATRAVPRLDELGTAFVEQPLSPTDLDGLRDLRRFGVPIVADESVFSLGDVARVVRADAADAVSVYVGKSGGLERALLAMMTLSVFGVGALVGSNGEFGLGAAAQIHVACACERLASIPCDIIGHHYYDEDVLAQPVPIDGLHAHLPSGSGLGVELASELLDRFR